MQHTLAKLPTLHIRIAWAAQSFRCYPFNILGRVFDITGFTVHTVLCIDLQPFITTLFFDNLIDNGRTITLSGLVVQGEIVIDWNAGIFQRQMAGLVFFVVCIR